MRTFHKLITAAIICVAAVSCKNPVPDIEPRDPVTFQNASATYYGATENHEAYFIMDLTDGDKKLHLEFYGDPVGDYDVPKLKTGNYSLAAGSATEPGTYIAGSGEGGCVYSEPNGADATPCNIVGGVFAISLSGTTYNVTVGLKDQDGKDLLGSYTGPITVEDMRERTNDFASGLVQFYGKVVTNDAHLFWVGLDSEGIVLDPEAGAYTGTGYLVRLSVLTGTDELTEIPDGTYPLAGTTAPGSILIDDANTYYAEVVDGTATVKPITSGTVTFQKSGDLYVVLMDVTDSEGNNYNKFYKGELEYGNYSGGLIDDLDLGAFASGEMTYYGANEENAYNFWVALLGNGVSVDSEGYISGSGYIIVMDMYSEMTSNTEITPATYVVDATYAPGSVSLGFGFWGWDFGSYIYEVENGGIISTVYITGGTVTASGANPSYNFQMTFKDSNGFNITGSYSGGLEYIDESSDNIELPQTSPTNRYRFTSSSVYNYKDFYETGTTNIVFNFETDNEEVKLHVDAVTPDIGDSSTVAPAGTYSYTPGSYLEYTFNEYSYIRYEDFYFDPEPGSTITITDLNDEGDRIYTFDLNMGDKGMFYGEYEHITPKNINLTDISSGTVEFYGSQYSDGISNNFYISLFGPGVSLVDGSYQGTGYIVALDIYTDLSATTEIPDGVYNVVDSREPGNIYISAYATRYFEIIDGGSASVTKPLSSGSATISKSGDTYTFDMAFVDSGGTNITGLFTGELEYINKAFSVSPGNYAGQPSAKELARETVLNKPDATRPAAKKDEPANDFSKDARKQNVFKYRKSTIANRFSKRP